MRKYVEENLGRKLTKEETQLLQHLIVRGDTQEEVVAFFKNPPSVS